MRGYEANEAVASGARIDSYSRQIYDVAWRAGCSSPRVSLDGAHSAVRPATTTLSSRSGGWRRLDVQTR